MTKFPRYWKGLLAAGAMLALVSADAAWAAEKIVIGAMYPMTGRAGRYGIDSVSGAEIAMEEINAKGGVNGRMIDIIFNDSKANPAYSVKVAKRYISEDKVNFLMGVVSSAVGLAVTEVSKENKVIFVGTDHASTALTTEKFQPYYFRVSNNTYQSAAAAAFYANDKKEWKKYYVIGPDYEYGHRTWEDFWMLLQKKRKDVQLVGQAWPKLFEPDYTPYITAILKAKPDVLVTTFWGGDTVAFIKQALPYKLFDKMKFYNYDGGGNYELLEAMPTGLPKGLILSARHHLNWPNTKLNQEFVKKFKAKTGRFPSYAAEGAYAGVYFIAEGVRQAGTAEDPDKLVAVMEKMKIKLPEDPDGFTSYMRPIDHQIVQVQAIGETVPNKSYPPATMMLGNFKVYKAEDIIPSEADIVAARKAVKK
ncbi:MAG: amino acid ABC transporter substrate-binding protein [Deltaproteobacteria bacterium]|nr:MAG: amino acid ABC transporter substrate-binding protein [Deltaproteobacteria bacterium]